MGYGAPDTRSIKREVSAMKLPKPLHHLATLLARKLIEEEVELPEACASAEVMAVRMLALANKLTTTTPLIIRHPGSSRPPTLADTSNTEVRELLRRLMPMAAIICPRPLNSDMEVDAAPPPDPSLNPPPPPQGGGRKRRGRPPGPHQPRPSSPARPRGEQATDKRGGSSQARGQAAGQPDRQASPPPLQSRPVGGEAGRREGGRLRGRQPGRPHPHPHSLSPPPPPPPPPPSTPALSGGSKALPTTGPPCKGGSSAAAQLPPEASKSPPFPAPPRLHKTGPGPTPVLHPGCFLLSQVLPLRLCNLSP